MDDTTVIPTNAEVGEKIGLTHSGVSRIRSGDRLPSLDTMAAIERAFGWSRAAQLQARDEGKYAQAFENVIRRESTTAR